MPKFTVYVILALFIIGMVLTVLVANQWLKFLKLYMRDRDPAFPLWKQWRIFLWLAPKDSSPASLVHIRKAKLLLIPWLINFALCCALIVLSAKFKT